MAEKEPPKSDSDYEDVSDEEMPPPDRLRLLTPEEVAILLGADEYQPATLPEALQLFRRRHDREQ